MIDPIAKTKVTGEVARRIQELIWSGKLGPGERLPPIRELAGQLNVGLTTVREALRQLETLGLVRIQHGAGVYVSESTDKPLFIRMLPTGGAISAKTRFDLLLVRKMLETGAAELAARRATPEQVENLREILSAMEKSLDDVQRFSEVDTEFHMYVAEISGNEILPVLLSSVRELIVLHQVGINTPRLSCGSGASSTTPRFSTPSGGVHPSRRAPLWPPTWMTSSRPPVTGPTRNDAA